MKTVAIWTVVGAAAIGLIFGGIALAAFLLMIICGMLHSNMHGFPHLGFWSSFLIVILVEMLFGRSKVETAKSKVKK